MVDTAEGSLLASSRLVTERSYGTGNEWIPYDPSWLIDLVERELPDERWLLEALAQCTATRELGEGYVQFKCPGGRHGTRTQLAFESPTVGWIVLDVFGGNRIGSLEVVGEVAF